MLKVEVTRMTMHVTARFRVTGSARCWGRRRGCFVMQALLRPAPIVGQTFLNRVPLDA
jgi:hypothetical protein